MKLLVVTNDFPPRVGGIEAYVAQLLVHLPRDVTALVLAPPHANSSVADRAFPHRVERWHRWPLLPTPRLTAHVQALLERERPDALVFGAAMPLALMARRIRRTSRVPIVAFTHGVEPAFARLPFGRLMVGSIARHATVTTAVSRWAEAELRRAVPPGTRIEQLPSGVDVERFHPGLDGRVVRVRHGIGEGPVVVCVSRLVRRKGQDVLIDAVGRVAAEVPSVRLLVVGEGPDRRRLERRVRHRGLSGHVTFCGSVPDSELPLHLAAADVFAMPCRTRLGGLDVEALGAVFLQAAAVGLPVIAGRSGGAPEAVRDGETGLVVDGRNTTHVEAAILRLLRSPAEARRFGAAGAAWVHERLAWDAQATRLYTILDAATGAASPRRTPV